MDHCVDVDVVVTVALTGWKDGAVVVEDVVLPVVCVEVDAWLIKFTVVVTVSPPPACHAGWNILPTLFGCASVKSTALTLLRSITERP